MGRAATYSATPCPSTATIGAVVSIMFVERVTFGAVCALSQCARPVASQDVLAIADNLQVPRINTSSIATHMIQGHAYGYRAYEEFVGPAVCKVLSPVTENLAVTFLVKVASPLPASIGKCLYIGMEAFCEGGPRASVSHGIEYSRSVGQ